MNWILQIPDPALEEATTVRKLPVLRLDTGRLVSVLEIDGLQILEWLTVSPTFKRILCDTEVTHRGNTPVLCRSTRLGRGLDPDTARFKSGSNAGFALSAKSNLACGCSQIQCLFSVTSVICQPDLVSVNAG